MIELTIPQIEEIAARAEKATPEDWSSEPHGSTTALYAGRSRQRHGLRLMNLDDGDSNFEANRDFIAAARTDVPALCSTALSAIRERDALQLALNAAPHGPFCTYLRSSHQEPCDCRESQIGAQR